MGTQDTRDSIAGEMVRVKLFNITLELTYEYFIALFNTCKEVKVSMLLFSRCHSPGILRVNLKFERTDSIQNLGHV